MVSFGTAGIRGIYPKELNEALVYDIIKRWAPSRLFLGRDLRKSSPSLYYSALSAGLSAGSTVYELGVIPTPTLALATKLYSAQGAMVTASHNPLSYNGLKLFSKGDVVRKEIANSIFSMPHRHGYGESIPFQRMAEKVHLEKITSTFGPVKSKERVLLHCNGATERLFPQLMERAGVSYHTYNCRGVLADPEPSEENLRHLAFFDGLVFSPDGDGDRLSVMYKGQWIKYDALAGWMAYHEVERLKRRVVAVNPATGLATIEFLRERGIEVVFAKTGTTYVWEVMEKVNAAVGTEPNGHIILRGLSAVSDALAMAYRFLQLWELDRETLLELNNRSYYRYDGKVPAADEEKEKVKDLSLPIEGKESRMDGLRIDGEDFWLLVRPSGTEHIIRYSVEAKSRERLKEVREKVEKALRELLGRA